MMMKTRTITALFAVLLTSALPSVRAAEGTDDAAAAETTSTEGKGFALKNRSSFPVPDSQAFNPFWPLGWTKSEASRGAATDAPADSVAASMLRPENFVVTSILLGEPPLAVINGRELAEGQIVAVQFGGQRLNVQVAAVQDGQVILRVGSQNLVVPLRRRGEPLTRSTSSATASTTVNVRAVAAFR